MTWQRRIVELMCAGGVLAGTGCPGGGGIPCGNANPDPCVCNRMPADSPQCLAETACTDQGGYWELFSGRTIVPDADTGSGSGSGSGSGIEGHCYLPGSPDAPLPPPDAQFVPDAASGAAHDAPHD